MTRDGKIAVLNAAADPRLHGGAEFQLLLLFKNINGSAFESTLLADASGELSEETARLGIPAVFSCPESGPDNPARRAWRQLSFALAVREIIRARRIDVVHFHRHRIAPLLAAAAWGTGAKLLLHAHVSRKVWADRAVAGLCSKIICVSAAAAERFKGTAGCDDKIRVIRNGVDLEKFNPAASPLKIRQEFGIGEASPVIGSAGRFVTAKGWDTLFAAFALVREQIPEARLLIAGRGPYEPQMRQKARSLGIDVLFAGFRKNMEELYAAFDVCAVSTEFNEGFCNVIVEALACGRPVVATKTGGTAETLEDGVSGFFVPPANPAELAGKIILLLKDKTLRAKLSAAARARAEAEFDFRKTSEKIQAVYREMHER